MVINITSNYPFEGSMESRIGGRAENQDSCGFSDTPSGLLVVICDGMGGGPAGKTASMIAIQTIIGVIKAAPEGNRKGLFQDAISQANAAIIKAAEETPANRGMGTTVIALLINERSAVIAHVGDSRLYKLRDGMKLFRTQDHSMVGEMVRKKILTEEQARLSAQSNIITRALGTSKTVEAEIDEVAFEKGDRFALCSDGIWGAFPEPQLIKKFSSKRLEQTVVEQLAMETDEVGKAKGGHHDNLTIALIKTNIDSQKKDKMTRLAKRIIAALIFLLFVCLGIIAYLNSRSNKIDDLNNQIAQLNEDIQNKDATISDLNKQIGSKNAQIDIANANVQVAKANEEVAKAHEAAAQKEKEQAEKERDIAKKQAEDANKSAQKASNTASQPKFKSLIGMLEALKNLSTKTKEEMRKQLKTCRNSIRSEYDNLPQSDKAKVSNFKDLIVKDWSDSYAQNSEGKFVLTLPARTKIKNLIEAIKAIK